MPVACGEQSWPDPAFPPGHTTRFGQPQGHRLETTAPQTLTAAVRLPLLWETEIPQHLQCLHRGRAPGHTGLYGAILWLKNMLLSYSNNILRGLNSIYFCARRCWLFAAFVRMEGKNWDFAPWSSWLMCQTLSQVDHLERKVLGVFCRPLTQSQPASL